MLASKKNLPSHRNNTSRYHKDKVSFQHWAAASACALRYQIHRRKPCGCVALLLRGGEGLEWYFRSRSSLLLLVMGRMLLPLLRLQLGMMDEKKAQTLGPVVGL